VTKLLGVEGWAGSFGEYSLHWTAFLCQSQTISPTFALSYVEFTSEAEQNFSSENTYNKIYGFPNVPDSHVSHSKCSSQTFHAHWLQSQHVRALPTEFLLEQKQTTPNQFLPAVVKGWHPHTSCRVQLLLRETQEAQWCDEL